MSKSSRTSAAAAALFGAATILGCDSSSGTNPSDASAVDGAPAEPVGCAAGPDAGGGYNPTIDPANFPTSTTIDNPFFSLVPGTVLHLKDTDNNIVTIEVKSDTKMIDGINTRVVHDTVAFGTGEISEDTTDWFAQDKDGNVWYMGETTSKRNAPNLPFSPYGTWTSGVDCAKPGMVMEAHPKVGDSYRQEFYAGAAEDQADVLALDETVTVPYGTFQHCLRTRDYTRFSPNADENKWYCPGLGNLKTVDLPASMNKHEDLISIDMPGGVPDAGDAGAGPAETGVPDAPVDTGSPEAGDGGGAETGSEGGATDGAPDVSADASAG